MADIPMGEHRWLTSSPPKVLKEYIVLCRMEHIAETAFKLAIPCAGFR